MAATQTDEPRRSYPYMPVASWHTIRARIKRTTPKVLNADWIASVLGVSEKAAGNIVPQLRGMGLMDSDGVPNAKIIDDLRDDSTYTQACSEIVEACYPPALLDAFDETEQDVSRVASWFMRNARTGEPTAKAQARFFVMLRKGELPNAEDMPQSRAKRVSTPKATSKSAVSSASADEVSEPKRDESFAGPGQETSRGPSLHIDLQIHISADAGREQIDAVFESMAKHVYGREQ